MPEFNLTTPVALIIFNRPDTTARIFEEVRKAKPNRLFIIADGPRKNYVTDFERCTATRNVVELVDWDCEVSTNYADENLGCGVRPATGISWVFEQVEEAIFLEDDCLPHPDFFRFCQEVLARFRDDERIAAISGTNINGFWKQNIQGYHYSYMGGNWGWAGWARAWKDYDYAIKLWNDNEIKDRIRDVIADKRQFNYISNLFNSTHKKTDISWWDYQWLFARIIQSRLTVVPSKNLISNIGFRLDATHTTSSSSPYAEKPSYQMDFPLKHNGIVAVDREYDQLFFKEDSLLKKVSSKILQPFLRK